MSFNRASWLRVIQLAPIPFAFISITTAAYVGMPKEASNQVAGLINFVRNIGGSIFIAITGAAVTNRALHHEALLQNHMNTLSIPFDEYSRALGAGLGQHFGTANSSGLASGNIYEMLVRQAAMQGYQDVYKMLFWMALGMVFLAFMLNKNRPGGSGGGGGGMH
jgi:MFS transporter, DHA2 family, multidrug resistance protein